jgi:hypothetical protein
MLGAICKCFCWVVVIVWIIKLYKFYRNDEYSTLPPSSLPSADDGCRKNKIPAATDAPCNDDNIIIGPDGGKGLLAFMSFFSGRFGLDGVGVFFEDSDGILRSFPGDGSRFHPADRQVIDLLFEEG